MNIKKYFKLVMALSIVSFFIQSCDTKESKFPGYTKTDDGLYYKFHVQSGDTLKAQEGDLISTYMDYRTDDTIFNSTPKGQPFKLPMMHSTYKGDVFAAIGMMSPGDSATFMIHADSFFTKTVGAPRPEFLDSNSYFYLDIKVTEIKTQAELDKERMMTAQAMANAELGLIETYIADNKLTINKDASGVYFSEVKKGNGKEATAGNIAKLNIVAKSIGTNGRPFIDSGIDGKPVDYEIGTGRLGIGFESAIVKMKEGGKALIIVPFDLGFGAQGVRGVIDPYATLVYEVEIVKVTSAAEAKAAQEKEALMAQAKSAGEIITYMKKNNLSAKPNPSGLYYISTLDGNGKQAMAGKKVKVHYTGTLLNGKKFDSSLDRGQPFEFTLGQGQVIPGWDEGIALMKEGGKAKLIIPSHLGYGSRGAGQDIPPNATLVFEVELLEVID